jgi:hypothetical protein
MLGFRAAAILLGMAVLPWWFDMFMAEQRK